MFFFVLLFIGIISGAAGAVFALVILPRNARALDENLLPRRGLARLVVTFGLRGALDTPRVRSEWRLSGYIAIGISIMCLTVLVQSLATVVLSAVRAHR